MFDTYICADAICSYVHIYVLCHPLPFSSLLLQYQKLLQNNNNTSTNILTGGVLPFGACFVELFFIMSSIWMDQYYYVFGFLLLVYVILGVTCAEITIVLDYFQLCSEGTYVRTRYTYVHAQIRKLIHVYVCSYVCSYIHSYIVILKAFSRVMYSHSYFVFTDFLITFF